MSPALKRRLRGFLPRELQAHSILTGPLRGYRIVTSWYDYPAAILGRTEGPLLQWFCENALPGQTWLDIGAHYGYTALALAKAVGPKGRVFAFEPMLASAGCLAQTRRLNGLAQLVVVPVGLGSTRGVTLSRLPVVRGMVDSTLLVGRPGRSAAGWEETLLVTCLDELWPTLVGDETEVHGIKLDVQGMELEVVSGMAQLLVRARPRLVVEVHTGVSRPALLELLGVAGYHRPAVPIAPVPGETTPAFHDDQSYVFLPDE